MSTGSTRSVAKNVAAVGTLVRRLNMFVADHLHSPGETSCALARFVKRFLHLMVEQLYPRLPGPRGGGETSVLALLHLADSIWERLEYIARSCGLRSARPLNYVYGGVQLERLYQAARSSIGFPHEVGHVYARFVECGHSDTFAQYRLWRWQCCLPAATRFYDS